MTLLFIKVHKVETKSNCVQDTVLLYPTTKTDGDCSYWFSYSVLQLERVSLYFLYIVLNVLYTSTFVKPHIQCPKCKHWQLITTEM